MRLPYEHPGTPDLRSPLSFLGWVGRGQWRTLAVATAFGVADTTVRTHVNRLFEKTGATRQADLVKLVAGYTTPLAN